MSHKRKNLLNNVQTVAVVKNYLGTHVDHDHEKNGSVQ